MSETVLIDAATVTAAASTDVEDIATTADIVTFRVACDQPHTVYFWGADATFADTDDAAEYQDERRTYVSASAGTGNLYLLDVGSKAYVACVVTNNGSEDAEVTVGAENSPSLIDKLFMNKTITDATTGTMTIYDDDDETPLVTANIYEDADGNRAYASTAINRRDRLT